MQAGDKYGEWTVLEFSHKTSKGGDLWLCKCKCEVVKPVRMHSLLNGRSKSCKSCANKAKTCNITHGLTNSPTYSSWKGMKERCTNENNKKYDYYGGRGVTLCERWHSFNNFLEDMGEKPEKNWHIDRIDVNGNYEPGNCRWITLAENNRNKRTNVVLEFNNESKCLAEWSRETGVSSQLFRYRLSKGWPIEEALFTPPLPRSLCKINNSSNANRSSLRE